MKALVVPVLAVTLAAACGASPAPTAPTSSSTSNPTSTSPPTPTPTPTSTSTPTPTETPATSTATPAATVAEKPAEPRVCDPCVGSSTSELEKALATEVKKARRCYEERLAKDSFLAARVTLDIVVADDGTLCRVDANTVQTHGSGNDPAGLGQCVAESLKQRVGYPAPSGGCLKVSVPIAFKSKK